MLHDLHDIPARALAHEFARQLARWLSVDDLDAINAKNDIDPDHCATHDFCDPNQAMIDALDGCGYDYHGPNETQDSLIDAAWTIARENGFLTNRIIPG